uniref:Uncharacterized protein n=1 Tax=Nothoprocta perdicaria TaxID=30464 RepID=A0A8C7EBM7_NOTPE
ALFRDLKFTEWLRLEGTSRDDLVQQDTQSSMYLCLSTSICKGVSERPRIRRAVSYR